MITNLITLYKQSIRPIQNQKAEATKNLLAAQSNPVSNSSLIAAYIKNHSNAQSKIVSNSSLITAYLKNQANINSAMLKPVGMKPNTDFIYKNELKKSFQNNDVKMLAIVPRIFNAKDKNKDAIIGDGEESGTFLNAIDRLDEVKSQGFNTLHLLPIHEPGKKKAMGTAGSLYSPLDLLEIDPMLDDKRDPRTVKEEFKTLKSSSTFVETLFTFCPPLPPLRLVLKVISEDKSGIKLI